MFVVLMSVWSVYKEHSH